MASEEEKMVNQKLAEEIAARAKELRRANPDPIPAQKAADFASVMAAAAADEMGPRERRSLLLTATAWGHIGLELLDESRAKAVVTCATCGRLMPTAPIRAWIGTPPPGWKPGDPLPHVCPPAELWKLAKIPDAPEPAPVDDAPEREEGRSHSVPPAPPEDSAQTKHGGEL